MRLEGVVLTVLLLVSLAVLGWVFIQMYRDNKAERLALPAVPQTGVTQAPVAAASEQAAEKKADATAAAARLPAPEPATVAADIEAYSNTIASLQAQLELVRQQREREHADALGKLEEKVRTLREELARQQTQAFLAERQLLQAELRVDSAQEALVRAQNDLRAKDAEILRLRQMVEDLSGIEPPMLQPAAFTNVAVEGAEQTTSWVRVPAEGGEGTFPEAPRPPEPIRGAVGGAAAHGEGKAVQPAGGAGAGEDWHEGRVTVAEDTAGGAQRARPVYKPPAGNHTAGEGTARAVRHVSVTPATGQGAVSAAGMTPVEKRVPGPATLHGEFDADSNTGSDADSDAGSDADSDSDDTSGEAAVLTNEEPGGGPLEAASVPARAEAGEYVLQTESAELGAPQTPPRADFAPEGGTQPSFRGMLNGGYRIVCAPFMVPYGVVSGASVPLRNDPEQGGTTNYVTYGVVQTLALPFSMGFNSIAGAGSGSMDALQGCLDIITLGTYSGTGAQPCIMQVLNND